ncbi:MAG: hypothetical protein CMJ41_06185 [Phycisphaerae bacterium]|nr:hypothetical protein [Phycisphaerae bacterium]
MKLDRLYPRLSFILVFTAIVAHCIAQQEILLVLLAGALAVASRSVCEGPRGRALPRPWSLLLTCVALVWAVVSIVRDPAAAIQCIGTFVVWLTLIKMYERRSIENEAERLILSLLLMVLAALVSIDLLFGLMLVAWTALAITVLLLFQLYHGQELVRMQMGQVVDHVAPVDVPRRPVMGPAVRRDFRRITVGLIAVGLAVSVALFIAVPRSLTTTFAQGNGQSDTAVSGFTDRVDLGGDTRITLSEEQVMTVGLQAWDGSFIQQSEPLRLRGSVLDRSVGEGVWESGEQRADWEYETEPDIWQLLELSSGRSRPAPEETVLQIFDLQSPLDTLFSMSLPIEIRTPNRMGLEFNRHTDTLSVTGDQAPLHYEIRAKPGPPTGVIARRGWYRYQNPVVRDVAEEVLRQAEIPLRRPRTPAEASQWNRRAAFAFEAFLTSRVFRYTLELDRLQRPASADGLDPVERFLLVDRAGHCEYFAAAFVALCHVVDVDARMVTGFVTDRYDPLIQRYVVLMADAHAWAEVELVPGTWTTFDPTPPAWTPVGRQQPPSFAQRASWIYGWFEHAWQSNVLGYDVQKQVDMVDAVEPWWRSSAGSVFGRVGDFFVSVNLAFGFGLGGYIWMGVVLVIVVLFVVAWRLSRRRHRRVLDAVSLPRGSARADREVARRYAFYVDGLHRLSVAGYAKPEWQSPAEFASDLAESRPDAADPMRRIVDRFYAMRFGGQPPASDHAEVTERALRELSDALDAGP